MTWTVHVALPRTVHVADAVRTPSGRRGGAAALARAGRSFGELDVLEPDEAVAAQVLARLAEWPAPDPAVLDPQGGAVAPLCTGVGQGLARVLERQETAP